MADFNISSSSNSVVSSSSSTGSHQFALVSLTSLFFMWGFITCLNDILIPHLKSVFSLNYTQAMLIQFCFFGAYFIISIPAGKLVKKIGFQRGIVIGLLIAGLGCTLFYPAASLRLYPIFLGALFVLASGITILQVSANPFVSVLGKPETAPSRLTMTQAFNSLGTTIAPFFGGLLILSATTVSMEALTTEQRMLHEAQAVQLPYLLLATSLFVLAAIFAKIKLPEVVQQVDDNPVKPSNGSAWQYRHLVLGALAIFVYVGAEVSIGSFLVNFLGESHIANLDEADAAKYIAYYWGGAMVGRFIGAVVMQKIAGGKVLFFNALCASVLIVIAIVTQGNLAMWSILAVGLFNSIMFPTIFSLAINGLNEHTSQGSGILCLAIVGGAILPLIQGALADGIGLQMSFAMPILCYVFIAYYGLYGSQATNTVTNQ